MRMFEVVPRIPEGLWIIEIFRAHVLEGFAGKIMMIRAAAKDYFNIQVKPKGIKQSTHEDIGISHPSRPARPVVSSCRSP
jgi:hypothetical protein